MKRLLAVLALVVLSLVAPGPAQAHNPSECLHEATVVALRTCVEHAADQGHIASLGVTRALFAKLDAAQEAVGRGQPAVAVHALEAFVRLVRTQAGIHIDSGHAEHLVIHAELVILELTA